MVVINEDESFSLSANVTSPGYQGLVLRGTLVRRTREGVFVAPLLPRMFYGVDGQQLGASWRQNLTQTGEQVILSRGAGGYPKVPDEEIYWRKIAVPATEEEAAEVVEEVPRFVPFWERRRFGS